MPTPSVPTFYAAVHKGQVAMVLAITDQVAAIEAIRAGFVLHPCTREVAQRAWGKRWPLEEPAEEPREHAGDSL